MAADVTSNMEYQPPARYAVSLSGDNNVLRDYSEKLSVAGTTTMPLEKQAWATSSACASTMIPWLVNISQPQA